MKALALFRRFSPLAPLVAVALAGAINAAAAVTGFPDSDAASGKFVNITRGLSSLGPADTSFGILTSPGAGFQLGIFDGNTASKWDVWSPPAGTPDQVWFTLYADPAGSGSTATMIGQWDGSTMADDAWFVATVANSPAALMTSGNYRYNLVVSWQAVTLANEQNNFKVRVEGQILAPGGGTYGFIGYTPADPDQARFGPSTYDGGWHFQLFLPTAATQIDLWNGDFDRAGDTHDANSPAYPAFPISAATLAEGSFSGVPADDAAAASPLLVSPAIYQTLHSKTLGWTVADGDPSGDKEWEMFRVGTAAVANADAQVSGFPPGHYEWLIVGADGRNTLFIHPEQDMYMELPGSIGDYVWFDANGDGCQNDGASNGLPNVGVELWWDSDGNGTVDTLLNTTTTNASGYYLFEELLAGKYEVRIVTSTLPAGVQPSYDYDGISTASKAKVTLGVAATNLKLDFGYKQDCKPRRFQGCTPGYWKQSQHFDSWVGYAPSTMYNSIFGVPYVKTMLQALSAGGGGERALGRHAAAALLNTTNAGVNYYYSTADVLAMVQQAYSSGQYETVKNLLAQQNEAGCPLN